MNEEYYYDQNAYYNGEQEPEMKERSNSIGLSIASLVLSLVSLVGCCCGLSFIAAPLSIIFGIVALALHHRGKGMAIAGIIVSAVMTLVTIYGVIAFGGYVKDYFKFIGEAETVIEEYQETGDLPDYLEKYNDEEYRDFWNQNGYDDFDDFFEDVIEQSGFELHWEYSTGD